MEAIVRAVNGAIGLSLALLGLCVVFIGDDNPYKRRAEIAMAVLAVLGVAMNAWRTWLGDRKSKDSEQSLAEMRGRIEGERSARLELELALAPRSIEQGESAKALLPFKGMNAILASTPDAEPTATAAYLHFLLCGGGWKVQQEIAQPGSLMGTGLLVETKVPGLMVEGDRSAEAAEELLEQLKTRSGVSGEHLSWLTDEKFPPNTMKITVGPVPPKYFQAKQYEEWKRAQQANPPE
jgi:hypothetical protein